MDHIAIMKKSWKLIPKILSGEKTIESRWYQTRRTPWNRVGVGDRLFFKNSGELVSVSADVAEVLQFEIQTIKDAQKIVTDYGAEICMTNSNAEDWAPLPKYCILLRLTNPKRLSESFQIDKQGFGSSTAWITVENIQKIRL
jgi:ASC-1-like (ASCH) protein